MKTLFVIVSFFLILLMGGCKESQINQPDLTTENDYNKTSPVTHTTIVQPAMQEIKLCCKAYDPVSGDCNINGKVSYMHVPVVYADGMVRVDLKIEMDAELCTGLMGCKKFSICGNSSHTIVVSLSGTKEIEKNYPVCFRPDLRVGVLYKVTAQDIGVSKICLYQVDQIGFLDHEKN